MADTMTAFNERAMQAHAEAVVRGEHDDECEWGPRVKGDRTTFYHLCHCSKRKREAAGFAKPPGELVYNAPSCPRCDNDVTHDGDLWTCYECRCHWPNEYSGPAEFFDDYGNVFEGTTPA